MSMEYNASPISVKEGKVFLDGIEILDCVTFSIKLTPEVWSGKQIGERTNSSRWLGYSIDVTMTRRRSTSWASDVIKEYIQSGKTPEFTFQGLQLDEASDFYAANGSDTTTVVGCVPTGAFQLTSLDSGGQVLDDSFTFSGRDIV